MLEEAMPSAQPTPGALAARQRKRVLGTSRRCLGELSTQLLINACPELLRGWGLPHQSQRR